MIRRVHRLRIASILGSVSVVAGCAGPAAPAPNVAAAPATRARGDIHEDVVFSQSLGVEKHLAIYLPPSYRRESTRRFPVVYYLHGLFGSETDWLSKGSLDVTADSLMRQGAPELIIVMPDGDDGWYNDWQHPVTRVACSDTLHNEAPDRYCVAAQRYETYLVDDVVSHVDGTYRTRADRMHRGIAGLSMGGYGALLLALKHPETFAAAASHSGVVSPMFSGPHPFAAPARYAETADTLRTLTTFWPRYEAVFGTDLARWRANDPARLAEVAVARGTRLPALFFDCGRDDGLIDQNRALDWELTRLRVAHRYAEWPGAHTWRYWSTHAGESLAWMAERIGG